MKVILVLYYDSQPTKNIELVPDEIYLNNNAVSDFSIEIDNNDLEMINIWRVGRDLKAEFNIKGIVLLRDNTNDFFIDVYEKSSFDISNETFINNVLDPANLLSKYVREFDTTASNIKPNTNLVDFHQQMNCFHSNLRNALIQYRKSPTKDNFNNILSQIRVNLNNLLNFKNDPDTINALEEMLNESKTIEH